MMRIRVSRKLGITYSFSRGRVKPPTSHPHLLPLDMQCGCKVAGNHRPGTNRNKAPLLQASIPFWASAFSTLEVDWSIACERTAHAQKCVT